MENLIFSLNATIPVFLLMVLGLALRKIGWIDEGFASKMNQFVFRVPLPVLLFQDLATVDFYEMWDGKFVFFCFAATFLEILLAGLLSLLLKDRSTRGSLSRLLTGAAPLFWGSLLFRIFTALQGLLP